MIFRVYAPGIRTGGQALFRAGRWGLASAPSGHLAGHALAPFLDTVMERLAALGLSASFRNVDLYFKDVIL